LEHLMRAGERTDRRAARCDRPERPMKRRVGATLLAVAFFAGSAGAADPDRPGSGAATAAPTGGASWAYDLAADLMSPFCPGRTLAACPSPDAAELIQWIALQEAAGASREEVVAVLVERHGEAILGAPPARGITLWAYVFPVLGFLAFGGVAIFVLRRIVSPRGSAMPATSPASGTSSPPTGRGVEASARPATAGAPADELARIVDAELAERA
jgi:cytochrome c-type biogenesis protein CcmH